MNSKFTTWTFKYSQIPNVEIGRGGWLDAQDVAIPDQWIKTISSSLKKEVTTITGIQLIEGIAIHLLSEC